MLQHHSIKKSSYWWQKRNFPLWQGMGIIKCLLAVKLVITRWFVTEVKQINSQWDWFRCQILPASLIWDSCIFNLCQTTEVNLDSITYVGNLSNVHSISMNTPSQWTNKRTHFLLLQLSIRPVPAQVILGTDHYFFPGGLRYRDWEKNCLHEKNSEINCLPKGCIWKKLSAGTTPVMRDFGNFKKIVCAVSGGKKSASAQSMMEKISCLLEIEISPSPGGNNGLSFTMERAARTLHWKSPCIPVCVSAKITCWY